MPVTIQTLMQGDTGYISKHNANYQNIKALLDALEAHVNTVLGSPAGETGTVDQGSALWGEGRALIGGTSFEPYQQEANTLNVRPGFLWDYEGRQVIRASVAQQFNFGASSPGTYYIHVNQDGGATVNQEHADAVWSVAWDGTDFDAVMPRLPIAWAFTDWQIAQFSLARAKNFNTLGDRLEEIEQILFPLVYDVAGTAPGVPEANDVILRYPFPRSVEFPAGLENSQGVSGIAATSQTVFSLRKNGTQIGTMTFAASATTATFSLGATTFFTLGDVLTVVAPDPADSTLADIGFCLAGTRTLETLQ